MVRKTINVDDYVNRLINVVIAKTLLDTEVEISYRDAVNSLLLLGLASFSDPKSWTTFEVAHPDDFLDELEDRIRKLKFKEEAGEFFFYLGTSGEEE